MGSTSSSARANPGRATTGWCRRAPRTAGTAATGPTSQVSHGRTIKSPDGAAHAPSSHPSRSSRKIHRRHHPRSPEQRRFRLPENHLCSAVSRRALAPGVIRNFCRSRFPSRIPRSAQCRQNLCQMSVGIMNTERM